MNMAGFCLLLLLLLLVYLDDERVYGMMGAILLF